MIEHFIEDINLFLQIVLGVFLLSCLVQLVFYLVIFSRGGKRSSDLNNRRKKYPPVSVIICAKNESENLSKYLPLILEQDYPDYEVVVVDDCSEDDTIDLLEELKKKYSHLKVSIIKKDPKFSHSKKLAITIGIKASKNEHLLFTDADCYPSGNQWIKHMARHFNEQTKIVLGIGLYEKKKSLLNLFIRFDTAFIAMQYISFARAKIPYMGVGRNLAYLKTLFFENKGFGKYSQLASGDDDLFVNKTASKKNTVTENHKESHTYSIPEEKWSAWIRQKKRHLTTSQFYQQSTKRILGLEYFTRIMLNAAFIIAIIKYPYPCHVLAIYGFLLFIKAIIFIVNFKRLNENFLFLPSLIIEPLIPVFYGILHISNYLERKKNRWS